MNNTDPRTYNHHEMWQRMGKSHKWLNGYDAGFESKQLPPTASAEYSEGYNLGCKDRLREEVPPLIKDGFSYGHGFKADLE